MQSIDCKNVHNNQTIKHTLWNIYSFVSISLRSLKRYICWDLFHTITRYTLSTLILKFLQIRWAPIYIILNGEICTKSSCIIYFDTICFSIRFYDSFDPTIRFCMINSDIQEIPHDHEYNKLLYSKLIYCKLQKEEQFLLHYDRLLYHGFTMTVFPQTQWMCSEHFSY